MVNAWPTPVIVFLSDGFNTGGVSKRRPRPPGLPHQTTVLGQVPVVLSTDVTLASGTITYWPVATPAQIGTLATGLAGGPGATLATFDTPC